MKTFHHNTISLLALSTFLLGAGASQAAVLAYEGFSSSASGTGDDYQYGATIRSNGDARTGFSGSWSNPTVATGLDFSSRDDNMNYNNFVTGTAGAFEIFESRTGQADANRSINRSLSYTTPALGELFFVFGWSTADPAALGFTLGGTRASSISVSTTGLVTSALNGASAQNFNNGTNLAHTDGTWNLLVLRVTSNNDTGASNVYDGVEFFLNPTLVGDGTLGTADFTGRGIMTEQTAVDGTRASYTSATFLATVGTGDEVRFDEFRIATSTADFLVTVPEPSTALLGGVGMLLLLRRRR